MAPKKNFWFFFLLFFGLPTVASFCITALLIFWEPARLANIPIFLVGAGLPIAAAILSFRSFFRANTNLKRFLSLDIGLTLVLAGYVTMHELSPSGGYEFIPSLLTMAICGQPVIWLWMSIGIFTIRIFKPSWLIATNDGSEQKTA